MSEELLQIFLKLPEPGKVKTRLAGRLGEVGAAKLAAELAERTILEFSCGFDTEIWYTPVDSSGYLDKFAESHHRRQQGDDLGARMGFALNVGLERSDKVILIGCDCPLINSSYVREAFRQLDDHDLVFGPAEDGGYGLVGVKRTVPNIFSDMEWGTETVLIDSCRRLNNEQVTYALLPPIWDVDRPEDLQRYNEWMSQESL